MPYPMASVTAYSRLMGVKNSQSSLLTGIAAYWNMNESTAQNRADSVGSATLFPSGTVTGAAGLIANGTKYSGSTSGPWLQTSSSALKFGDTTFSFAFWTFIPSISGFPMLFGADHDDVASNHNYGCYCETTKIHWYVYNAAGVQKDMNLTVNTNAWVFCYFYHDSVNDQIGMSINNGTISTLAMAGSARAAGVEDFWVGGAQLTATPRFVTNGMFDEFGAWNRLLNATELTNLYNGGNGVTYPF